MAKETWSEISFQDAANVAWQVEMVLAQGAVRGLKIGLVILADSAVPRLEYSYQLPYSAPSLQSFQGGYSGRQGQIQGQQSQQPKSYYTCGDTRHIAIFCIQASGSSQHQGSRAMVSAPSVLPPAQPARDTVLVCSRNASILFDPRSTYYYMSSYFASYLVVPRDFLNAPVDVSTPVGDFIVVDRVYHSCVVVIRGLETRVDLLLLDMVDFDIILRMDWLTPYHAILDYHAKTVTLALPGFPCLEWRGTPGHSTSRVISYMKARRMVDKGCLAYLAYVRDFSAEVPSMDSLPIVSEFPKVFPADLLGMPPDRDIDFCIDLAPGTQPISILPYHIAPPELKELKEQLQDLLDKGFIRPSVLP
ncbi:uncharacterized protein [Nicotiana sylvestris]|uniref:uncharacterized protein n=1 Tax=Nicotiana sylvestris TaxID=4096 RepID=UPI00388CC264